MKFFLLYVMISIRILAFLLIIIIPLNLALGQEKINTNKEDHNSTEHKNSHKRDSVRKILKGERFLFKINGMNAYLTTSAQFKKPEDGILAIQLSLEDNFGLADSKYLVSVNGLYRISPKSGLFGQYYGLNRNHSRISEEDIIFKEDTIPKGTQSGYFFSTRVISIGYMHTLIESPRSFFGIYFSAFMMNLEVGITSDQLGINNSTGIIAPLPDLGLSYTYKIKPWLHLDLLAGMFFAKVGDFTGWLHNFSGLLVFKPAKWFGISIGYQAFNLNVKFLEDNYNATIEYSFRGPGLGVSFLF